MRRVLYLILVVLLFLPGCGVHTHLPTEAVHVKDSTVFHVKDSIAIRYDTVRVELPVESHSALLASSEPSHLETSLATSDAWIDSTGLHHTLANKEGELEQVVPIEEHYHSEEAEFQHSDVQEATIIQEVEKELTWWQKLWICSGKILWSLVGFLAIFGIVKLLARKI